jgi:hypothetical protein
MVVGDLRIVRQADASGLLSFRCEFSIPDHSVRITSFVFHSNIADEEHGRLFPVDASLSVDEREAGLFMVADVANCGFDESVPYDDRTNISALKLTGICGDGAEFEFLIPVFCSGDGEGVRLELMAP